MLLRLWRNLRTSSLLNIIYTKYKYGTKSFIEWYRVAKYDITKIKICKLMRFVEIIRAIETKNVSLLKISMLVQIVSGILPQLCSNDSIQILLKMVWFLMLGTKPIFIRICMGSSEHNRGNISSLIGGKMLNFSMEASFILVFLNIKTKLVILQNNQILWYNYFSTLLLTWLCFLMSVNYYWIANG